MREQHESSGLHSLAALRELEQKRARDQAEAARARAEAEQSARLERQALRREQERQSAERAARELAESAQLRSDIAERVEAECSAAQSRRTEELRLSLNQEREARRTAELRLTARLLQQRFIANVASALYLATALGALAAYFGALRPTAERALGAAEQALRTEKRAHAEAEANVLRGARRAAELSLRVDSLEQRLREAPGVGPVLVRTQQVMPQRPGAPHGSVKVTGDCVEDGDPLNPCLRR